MPVLASSVVELALRTASALLIFICVFMVWGVSVAQWKIAVAVLLLALTLVCAHPRIMLPIANFVLRKLKKTPINRALRPTSLSGIPSLAIRRRAGENHRSVPFAAPP